MRGLSLSCCELCSIEESAATRLLGCDKRWCDLCRVGTGIELSCRSYRSLDHRVYVPMANERGVECGR